MSIKQAMIWTVLPVGQTEVTGRVKPGIYLDFSVIISPRLESSSSAELTLSDFPDWSQAVSTGVNPGRSWPDTIAALAPSFGLHLPQLPGSQTYHAEFVHTTNGVLFGSQSPDSTRWAAMFPPNTPVTPYVFKGMGSRQIRSAPVGQLSDTITSLYGKFGVSSPTAFPLYEHLAPADAFGAIGFQQLFTLDRAQGDQHPDPGIHGIGVDRKKQLTDLLEHEIKQSRAIPYDLVTLAKSLGSNEPPGAATSLAFIQEQQFLQRGLKPHTTPVGPVTPPDWDFHQIVAAIGSQPSLLRILGLVLDLRAGPVGPEVLAAWKTAAANKKLVPTEAIFVFNGSKLEWAPGTTANHTQSVRPPTATDTDLGVFRAQPLDPGKTDLDGRMLKLGDRALYRIIRLDHDNAAIKAMQFADNVTRSRQQGQKLTLTTPDRFALPALRTGGFAIARSGRAVQMAATLERQTTALQDAYFGSAAKKPLYAEDITRGYRFDVFSKPDPVWRSLMWRQGTITVTGTPPVSILEEDTVVPAPTTATKSGAGDLYLQETLTRWDGWSLGVPRIGTAFYDPNTQSPPPSNQGSTGFNLATNWQVPGSTAVADTTESSTDNVLRLPRLRFGWPYQLRGRAVDLAGNSLLPALAPKTGAALITAYETHLRVEPVPAPRMLLLSPPDPAASEEVMVVRSENATQDGTLPIDTGVSTRIILPAPTSVFMAEQHGAWDLPATGKPMDDSTVRYDDIALRDATTIESLGTLENPSVVHSQTNPYLFPGYQPITYLPEFIGRTALIRGLPINSSKQTVAKLPFDTVGAGWPKLQACRIQLTRGVPNWHTQTVTDPGDSSNVTTELFLTLGKGDMITCLLNCEIDAAALDVMGVWEWIQTEAAAAGLSSAKINAIRKSILAGEHWMFTPWREIRFVHAVRTPLLAPRLFLSPSKSAVGQTYAAFLGLKNALWGTVEMSRKSTARIDVDATWAMPIDTGTNADPVTPVQFAGHAFSLEIPRIGIGKRPDAAGLSGVPLVEFENFDEAHQFGDTKFRAVNYSATATSFYIEYFRQQLTLNSTADPIAALRTAGAVKPGVAFEGTTVKLLLVGTDTTDPSNPKIQTRPLVEAPIGTDPTIAAPTPGDYVVVQDPTLASDPSGAVNGTVQILTNSTIKSSDVKGTPTVVFSYVGPTIHTYSDPSTDHTTAKYMYVPNAARPAAPDVLYVIPVYKRAATNKSITRTGGALRVYMNRPWWSSGDKERLGVVCWHQGSKNTNPLPPSSLAPYVTQWGFDPIHVSRETLTSKTKQPTPSCFPFATANSGNGSLTIAEVSGKVDVAGHDVGFDSTRNLWYADIKVTSPSGAELESYTPFIRFAFARYQPTSIPDTHLSKVVTVDYAQLAPNRHVTVVGSSYGNNGGQFAVTVAGYAPITTHKGKASTGASRMRLTVESKDDRILDDALAWKPMTVNGRRLSQDLASSVADTDRVTWSGSVVIPSGASQTRMTIEEFELIDGSERLAFTDSIPVAGLVT